MPFLLFCIMKLFFSICHIWIISHELSPSLIYNKAWFLGFFVFVLHQLYSPPFIANHVLENGSLPSTNTTTTTTTLSLTKFHSVTTSADTHVCRYTNVEIGRDDYNATECSEHNHWKVMIERYIICKITYLLFIK